MLGKAGIPLCSCSGDKQCPRLLEYEMICNQRIHKVNHLHNTNLYFLTLVTFILGGITYAELSNDFCLPDGSKPFVTVIGIISMWYVLLLWRLLAHSIDDGIIKLYLSLAEIEASHEMKFTIGERTLTDFIKDNSEMEKSSIKKYFHHKYARGHHYWNWLAIGMAVLSALWLICISNVSAELRTFSTSFILTAYMACATEIKMCTSDG